jgi:hypothetical protein
MTYNTRVFVGLAAILLVAVVFAQPSLGSYGVETYTSTLGLYDMSELDPVLSLGGVLRSNYTNPGFETDKAADGQGLSAVYSGWTKNTGSSGSMTLNPNNSMIYGSDGNVMPAPLLPGQGSNPNAPRSLPSCTPPNGFVIDHSGSQVLATWKDAFIAQTMHTLTNTSANWTVANNQTYVMTWEYGTNETIGGASGVTVGLFYNGSSAFLQCNDDTCYDSNHTQGGYGNVNGYMYQYAWSFASNLCTKNYVGQSMTIRLGGGTTGGTGYNYFDNIHLYGPVPEPSTAALLVTGALGMLAYAWRRKRRK